jgi:hypothetical protein
MRLQMIDCHEFLARCRRHSLRSHHPDNDAADQTRAAGRSDGVKVRQADFRVVERAAISGTTPPKGRCAAIWLCTTFDKIRREPSTIAAAVSSQLVSIPSISILLSI